MINTTIPTAEELERLFPYIHMGGHWQPNHCKQRQKLGIFIPIYRDRWHQLPILMRHLHQLLVSQWRHYTVYVIEQIGIGCLSVLIIIGCWIICLSDSDRFSFNRGQLFNLGVIEALKIEPDLDCYIFHDVDTLPETTHTMYKCHEDPRLAFQMATFQKKKNYKYRTVILF